MNNSQDMNEPRKRRSRRRSDRSQYAASQPEAPAFLYKTKTAVNREDLAGPLAQGSYIVFDIETTGGNPERNGITEIFALRYEGGEVKDTFYSMVNPRVPIPGIVRRMTGITNKMVRDAPPIKAVMPDFIDFIGNHILVSHNTIGDLKFLVYFARKACAHDLQNFFLCTHLLTEKLIPESTDKSLQGLGKFFGLQQGPVHRATEDSYLTLELFKILLTKLDEQGITRIEDAIRLQGDMDSGLRIGWALHHNAAEDLPDRPGVLKLYDRQDRPLFVSSSFKVKRCFAALQQYTTQPRQLQRVILQSYRLEWEEHPHIFAAMLAEARLCTNLSLRYHPEQWHMRFVPALCLKKEGNDHMRLVVASVTAGVTHAFGPIYDKKAAQNLVESIASIFQVPVSRKGVLLPAAKAKLVIDLFENTLPEQRAGLTRKLLNFKYIFDASYRQEVNRQDEELGRLKAVKLHASLGSLLHENGVIVAPHAEGDGCDLYPVVAGRPGTPQFVAGPWQEWLRDEGKAFLDQVQTDHHAASEQAAIGRKEATFVNAALWIIYAGRGKKQHQCHYYSLAELPKVVAAFRHDAPVPESTDTAVKATEERQG